MSLGEYYLEIQGRLLTSVDYPAGTVALDHVPFCVTGTVGSEAPLLGWTPRLEPTMPNG